MSYWPDLHTILQTWREAKPIKTLRALLDLTHTEHHEIAANWKQHRKELAKPEISPYRELKGKTTWIKIKNPEYSQAEGRRDLFNAPRRVDKRATPQKRRKR